MPTPVPPTPATPATGTIIKAAISVFFMLPLLLSLVFHAKRGISPLSGVFPPLSGGEFTKRITLS
jgi:hypothetical protein